MVITKTLFSVIMCVFSERALKFGIFSKLQEIPNFVISVHVGVVQVRNSEFCGKAWNFMNVLELTVVHLLRAVRLRGGPGRAAAVTPPLCMGIGDD